MTYNNLVLYLFRNTQIFHFSYWLWFFRAFCATPFAIQVINIIESRKKFIEFLTESLWNFVVFFFFIGCTNVGALYKLYLVVSNSTVLSSLGMYNIYTDLFVCIFSSVSGSGILFFWSVYSWIFFFLLL